MLFGVVCHSLPCVAISYYDVWPSPYNATTICCGPSSFTLCCYCLPWCIILRLALLLLAMVDCLHLALLLLFIVVCCYCLCGSSPFALHCYCLLWCIAFILHYCCLVWCIVPGLALLLFVVVCHPRFALLLFFAMVHHPSPYTIAACCDALPLPCIITACCGLSFLTLCGLLLLVLFCYFIIPCPFQVLTSPSFVLLFVVVYHSFALCYYFFVEVMYSPPLAMCKL